VQYFRVVLSLDDTDQERMKPGARVRAEIVIADLEDSITVPRQAVGTADGAAIVWRRGGDGFEEVPVSLGPSALGRVAIVAGLTPGDEIALRNPALATAGDSDENGPGTSGSGLGGGS